MYRLVFRRSGILGLLLSILICLGGLGFTRLSSPPGQLTIPGMSRLRLSTDDEARMSREIARRYEDENPIWDDPLLEAYLTEIMQRLVRNADPSPFTFRLRVVEDSRLNAFTPGGGFIYVTAGLIARLENEAQLALVLGHEIAHVTKRHLAKALTRDWLTGVVLGSLEVIGDKVNWFEPEAFRETAELVLEWSINGYDRKLEKAADKKGLEYAFKADYDPLEAPYAFEQLYKEYGDPPWLVNFFWGDHPRNVKRFRYTSQLARRKRFQTDRKLIQNTEEFKRRTRDVVIAVGTLDYQEKRFLSARSMFEKAVKVREEDPLPHYYLGRITLETGGALDQAIAHLTDAVKFDSGYAPAYRELGFAYYRKDDKVKSVEAFERYLALEPDSPDAAQVQRIAGELRSETGR